MNILSAKYAEDGSIGVTVEGFHIGGITPEHPQYEEVMAWVDAGNTIEPAFTQEQLANKQLKSIESAIERHMDEVAQLKGWDSRWTCVARAGYTNQWQAEGAAFGQWMDECWELTIQAQSDIANGLRTIPTEEEAIAELPSMVWPV